MSKFVYVQMFCEMEQCVAAFRHFNWSKLSRTHVGQRYCHCLSLFPLPSLCPLSCFATPTSLSLSSLLPLLWKSRTAHISEPMKSSGGGKTQKEISKWDMWKYLSHFPAVWKFIIWRLNYVTVKPLFLQLIHKNMALIYYLGDKENGKLAASLINNHKSQ